MLDLTKPVQTKSGRKARILCCDREGEKPIVALVGYQHSRSKGEDVLYYHPDGMFAGTASEYDLVNIPERCSRFANIYSIDDPKTSDAHSLLGSTYSSLELTKKRGIADRVGFLELIYQDGKMVDVQLHRL